jgi:hypothetical protein
MLVDLQRHRCIVASGRTPLYEDLDSCAHAPLNSPARALEAEEIRGFSCEFLLGSTEFCLTVRSNFEEFRTLW